MRDFTIMCLGDTENATFELNLFSKQIEKFVKQSNMIIHLGDGVCDFRNALTPKALSKVSYIQGNHDSEKYYPKSQEFELANLRFFFYHGSSFNPFWENFDVLANKIRFFLKIKPNLSWYFRDQYKNLAKKYDVVVHGHIHQPRLEKINNTIFFSPSSFTPKSYKWGVPLSLGLINIHTSHKEKYLQFRILAIDNQKKSSSFKIIKSRRYALS